ncbi:MAG: ATP-binding protein, partial [Thiothrix sp.]
FTPFFTTKRSKGGTGLGLEIITSILKAYGGSIRLGEAEQGAAFEFQLLLQDPKANARETSNG